MANINGSEINASGKTVYEYLIENNYTPARVAVELNGEILSKTKFNDTIINENDNLEIVGFVGGG